MKAFALLNILLVAQSLQPVLNLLIPEKETEYDLDKIQHARIDLDTLTVSGISSGGYMSIMLHYMYSSKFKAAGSFAGGPFGILYNVKYRNILPAYVLQVPFIIVPWLLKDRTSEYLQQQAISLAAKGLIDPIENLHGSKSYVFQGGADPVNPPLIFKMSKKASDMYRFFGSDIKEVFRKDATHCVPTDYFGPYNCPIFKPPTDGVNNCNYQGINDMFSHFYGSAYVPPPKIPLTLLFKIPEYSGKFYKFSQLPYQNTANGTSRFMNTNGGIYIPEKCANPAATCKLHLALHGCAQSIYSNLISDVFAKASGYFQVADTNNVIIVFPRAAPAELTIQIDGTNFNVLTNWFCWDWFGLTSYTADLKDLPQVQGISEILNTVIGETVFTQ